MALFRVLCCVVVTCFINYEICNSQCDNDVAETADERDRRSNKGKLKVVTYNVEWLYDVGCRDITAYTEKWKKKQDLPWGFTGASNDTLRMYGSDGIIALTIHQKSIAEYLDIMDADIYIIQEVCDCGTLEIVRKKMEINGKYYRSYLVPNNKEPTNDGEISMQTGIITKIDPQPIGGDDGNKANIKLIDDAEIADRMFRAVFDIGTIGRQLIIYGAHLKAGMQSDDIMRRDRQSVLLNSAAARDAINANVYVIIAGDLNTNKIYTVKNVLSKQQRNDVEIRKLIEKWKLNDDLTTNGFDIGGNSGKHMHITNGVKIYQFIIKAKKQQDVTIDCKGKDLEWFTSKFVELATKDTTTSYAIYFCETPLMTLSQNGFDYQIVHSTGDPISHYLCHHEKNVYNKAGILDYIFVSNGIMDDLQPKLEYIHEKFSVLGVDKRRVCSYKDEALKIYSDHSPVKVTLDTSNATKFVYDTDDTHRTLMDGNDDDASIGFNIDLSYGTLLWTILFIMIGIVSALYLSGHLTVI